MKLYCRLALRIHRSLFDALALSVNILSSGSYSIGIRYACARHRTASVLDVVEGSFIV